MLHARQATILSFDYDNVVQGLVDDLCLGDWSGGNIGQLVTSDDIVDHLPPRAPVSNAYWGAGQVVQSLRLLKLHGSLSWYWNPDDATGITLWHVGLSLDLASPLYKTQMPDDGLRQVG